MATKGSNKSTQGSPDLRWSDRVRGAVGGGSNVADNKKRDAEDVPWALIVTVLAILLMFFIIMPVLAVMYHDMFYATRAAVHEVKKMKELRRQILQERVQKSSGAIDVDREPAEAADPRQ